MVCQTSILVILLDYHVNPSGIPNITDENKIVNAVNTAFNTWTGITTANFNF
jgi:hypothetical protein